MISNFKKYYKVIEYLSQFTPNRMGLIIGVDSLMDMFEEKYSVSREDMAFVGDDYFDLSMFKNVKRTFCPSDAPQIIKDNAFYVCQAAGGTGVLVEICDLLIATGTIRDATEEEVAALDKLEATSGEMK